MEITVNLTRTEMDDAIRFYLEKVKKLKPVASIQTNPVVFKTNHNGWLSHCELKVIVDPKTLEDEDDF